MPPVPSRFLWRFLWRDSLAPGFTSLALLMMTSLGLEAMALVIRSPIVPDPADFALALLALSPSLLPLLLPIALLLGLSVGLGRWWQDGTWSALRATGIAGRQLLGAALLLGLATAIVMLIVTHTAAPRGYRLVGEITSRAASRARLLPNHFLRLDDTVLLKRADGSLFVFDRDMAILSQGQLRQGEGGLDLLLEHGVLLGPTDRPALVEFQQASLPLTFNPPDRRIQLIERGTPELTKLVTRMVANGKDASYEKTVLLKRWTLPAAAMLLPFLALPMGLRWGGRPSHSLMLVMAYWMLVRIGDASCGTLGATSASTLPLVGLSLGAVLLWARWPDR